MNQSELKGVLKNKIYEMADKKVLSLADTFKAYLKYELSVANTELALSSKTHGYNFKVIPEVLADNIQFYSPERSGGKINLRISIPQTAIEKATDEEIAYFRQYVLGNTITKMKNGY